MEKIICVGNQSEDTMIRSSAIAQQYDLPLNGLINDNIDCPGVWYTDIGSISFENLLFFGECADLLIVLDQPIESYDQSESFYTTQHCGRYLKKFTRVIMENTSRDVYITINFQPPNLYNADLHRVKNNTQIVEVLSGIDLAHRRVFVEFGTVDNVDQFEQQLNTVISQARNAKASLVIFRASKHEVPEELHKIITQKLLDVPEFVLLTPGVFNNYHCNIQRLLENHWQMMYGRPPEQYHKAYTRLL